jgi:Uma2 family endonuclease
MANIAKRRATYDDVLAAPEHMIAEIIDGELVTQPRPATPHARAASVVGGELHSPFDRGIGGPGGWIILYEPELHLHGDVVVPDLAGWRRERMPEMPHAAAFELAPDWVCEVLSPTTAATDRVRKMHVYARERVAYAWLVDPIAQTLEAYRLEGERWLQLGAWNADEKVRAEPFESFELELAALWAR